MAGFLPNVPGVRIPYHRDGSLCKVVPTNGAGAFTPTGGWSSLSSSHALALNDGSGSTYTLPSTGSDNTGGLVSIVFPQPVTLTGHNLLTVPSYTAFAMYTSTDTVDGTDGNWGSITTNVSETATAIEWRSITGVSIPNVVGVRVGGWRTRYDSSMAIYELQLYAQWSPATLAAWHPTLDQQIDGHHLDFGNVFLGNIYYKQFRIKNGHSLTANNVVVSCTSGTTELINGLALSLDGSTYTPSVTIASIAPGAITPIVHVRRTVSAAQGPNIIAMAPIDFIATTWT